jgi:HD-GYP domain-containing protein (c-di-GMP phosphodiesterase class II)
MSRNLAATDLRIPMPNSHLHPQPNVGDPLLRASELGSRSAAEDALLMQLLRERAPEAADDQIPSDPVEAAAAVAGARVLEHPGLDRRYVVFPLDFPRSQPDVVPASDGSEPASLDETHLNALLDWHRTFRQLELERDEMASRVAHDFEQLHWLRELAMGLAGTDASVDLRTVAENVLPGLRRLIGAEAVALVRESGVPRCNAAESDNRREGELTFWSGEPCISTSECFQIIQRCRDRAVEQPVVFNRRSALRSLQLETTARNLVVVRVHQCGSHYGWLIAVNCHVAAHASHDESLPREFGTHEAGLMTTAAAMLAGQARNIELFSAEEHLRLGIIESMTGAVDARDPYTCGHSRRVAQMASRTADVLGFSLEHQQELYVTGLMHDVGKIGIPDGILKKTGSLTDEEFEVIKQHPTIGHAILTPLRRLVFVLPGVLHHHERLDGRGYPHGLAGEEIPVEARILAVVDSFDAMTSDRAYRSAMLAKTAVGILREGAGTQWDQDVVSAFIAEVAPAAAAHNMQAN